MAITNATDNEVFFTTAIKTAVTKEIEKITEEESLYAAERVKARVKAEVDNIALSVLSHYDMQKQGNNFLITVRKEIK